MNYLNISIITLLQLLFLRIRFAQSKKLKIKKRQPAKRWNEAKIERTVDKFTDDFISNVYDKLYKGVKADRNTPRNKWIEFIETNEILDSLEESVSMMEIGED